MLRPQYSFPRMPQQSYLMGFKQFTNKNEIKERENNSENQENSVDFSALTNPEFNAMEFVRTAIQKAQSNKSLRSFTNSYRTGEKENTQSILSEQNTKSKKVNTNSYSTLSMASGEDIYNTKKSHKNNLLISPKSLKVFSPQKSKLLIKPLPPFIPSPFKKQSRRTEISPGRVKMESKSENETMVTIHDKESNIITSVRDCPHGEKKVISFSRVFGEERITVITERNYSEEDPSKCVVVTKTIIGKCEVSFPPPR